MNEKKLLLHERVEVRQFEEGLKGSWYSGVVVGVSELSRSVEYDELLSETGDSKLIESIPVSEAIEGLHSRRHVSPTYRGRIRPLPPKCQPNACKSKLNFGVCVDVLFEDAWWEGVIFDDNDDSNERFVYFPDEGDERKFSVSDLRVSLVWDEYLGQWRERGIWILVQFANGLEKGAQLSHFIKRVWVRMRSNYGFVKMISEWTCSIQSLWSRHFREVVDEIAVESTSEDLLNHTIPACLLRKGAKKSKSSALKPVSKKRNATELKQTKDNFARRIPISRRGQSNKEAARVSIKQITCSTRVRRTAKYIKKRIVKVKAPSKENRRVLDAIQTQDAIQTVRCRIPICRRGQSRKEASRFSIKQGTCSTSKKTTAKYIKKSIVKVKVPSKETRKVLDAIQTQDAIQTVRCRIPICRRGKSHKEPSRVSIKQRTCSTREKRTAKYINKSFVKVKAPSKESLKVLDAIQKQDDISASCQLPVLHFPNSGSKVRLKDMVSPKKRKRKRRKAGSQSDSICIVCQDGGDLILCDHCPTSYHLNCIHLKDVPDGTWFCPLCCCGLCGLRNPNGGNQLFSDICHQCSRQYHLDCLSSVGEDPLKNFCSKNCFELCQRLHQLLGISHQTSVEGLTWKLIRSTKNDCDSFNTSRTDTSNELSRALEVIHECFEPSIDPHTNRDLVHDVIFNSVSKLRRLDFRGFYVMVLQKGTELVSVATIRIHGQKVAEMPLIGTPFKFRRQGMCRLLVQELEMMLTRLGIERIVLPAISQLSETWKSSFDFQEMSIPQRIEFIGYPFLCFYGTKMFKKDLSESMAVKETRSCGGAFQESGRNSLRVSQEYQILPDSGKKLFGLCYTRKTKLGNMGKENMVRRSNGNVSKCKYVYKRRRIWANK